MYVERAHLAFLTTYSSSCLKLPFPSLLQDDLFRPGRIDKVLSDSNDRRNNVGDKNMTVGEIKNKLSPKTETGVQIVTESNEAISANDFVSVTRTTNSNAQATGKFLTTKQVKSKCFSLLSLFNESTGRISKQKKHKVFNFPHWPPCPLFLNIKY